jgi:hypothetical protein
MNTFFVAILTLAVAVGAHMKMAPIADAVADGNSAALATPSAISNVAESDS